MQTKGIALLGATGSIGRQAADIIRNNPDRYRAEVVTGGSRVPELADVAKALGARRAVIADESRLAELRSSLNGTGIECLAGEQALAECVCAPGVDTVLTATVGYSGLAPTIAAIKAGKDIALANKETLVVAGELISRLLAEHPEVNIYPVDSEHSAIAQCLAGEDASRIERLLITASGGPFRTWSRERIANATATDALRHPNWSMGAKITIDSATMMNKAFEIIEAHYLFGVAPERIEAVVHPQSVVHSMVEFTDGAIKAQLGVPDMHLPIAYALGEHTRLDGATERLTLDKMRELTFEAVDAGRFPCFSFAERVLRSKGNTACAVNAANEVAVAAFLTGDTGFYGIADCVEASLAHTPFISEPSYDDYVETNRAARRYAAEFIKKQPWTF